MTEPIIGPGGFDRVLPILLAGGVKIRRVDWDEGRYLAMRDGGIFDTKPEDVAFYWLARQSDIVAKDWVVV